MPIPDKYQYQEPKKEEKPRSLFDHFSKEAREQKSQSELEAELAKELKDLPEQERMNRIAGLVTNSYLSKYSKEDLKKGFSSFNSSLGMMPSRDMLYLYRFIPKEKRYNYLDECVDRLVSLEIIDPKNDSQVRSFKARLLNNIIMAQEAYKGATA